RVPQPVALAIASIRGGDIKAGSLWRGQSSKTFPVIPGMQYWKLIPPEGHSLVLPFPEADGLTVEGAAKEARVVLSGGLLLTYLATWALWDLSSDPNGLFQITPEAVADLRGFPVYANKKGGGRTYGKAMDLFLGDIKRLCNIGIDRIDADGGSIRASSVEA